MMNSEDIWTRSEISKIKPTNVKQRTAPRFTYNTGAYDSYIQEGFDLPNRLPDKFERQFLSRVDVEKGPIKVRITTMIRQLGIDYSTEKQLKKEYLTFISDWHAKNWLDAEVPPVISYIEGKHMQQMKRLVTKKLGNGEEEAYYEKAQPREVFTIPFTKKAVDDILFNEHPFGKDSLNITDPDKLMFYGSNQLGIMPFRCGDYTYEQFVTPEWKQFVELAIRPGGPANRKLIAVGEKQQHIT